MADNYGRPRRPLIAAAYLSAAMALSACGSTLSRDVEPEGPTGGTAQRMSVGVDSMISAANPYAAQAGFEILKIGGSAIDAAIAAQMVLTLVEPQSSGIGGGAYMLHWDQGKKEILAYDGRETAPAQADRNYFHLPSGEAMSRRDAGLSGRSVGVPGVLLMLWEAHKRHGRLPWKNLFEQAIELAERGFAISPRLHGLVTRFKNIKANAASRKYFLDKRGKALPVGRRLVNSALAAAFREIAEYGPDAFYRGPRAARIAAAVRATHFQQGLMTATDLADYRVKIGPPICLPYRKYRVCGVGPSTSGGATVAMMLGILQRFDIGALKQDQPAFMHLFFEAGRLAYADRAAYLADPDFVRVPLTGLLDPAYLGRRSQLIHADRPMETVSPGVPAEETAAWPAPLKTPEPPSTTHFSIVDAEGNAVSMTSTVGWGFGSGMMVDGFLLNNQLVAFNWMPNSDGSLSVNHVRGGKRPRSSLAPTMVFKPDGELRLVIGSPGGRRIIPYVAKSLIAVIDWGMDIQSAISLPNLGLDFHGAAELERETWAVDQRDALAAMGHTVNVKVLTSGLHGIEITDEGLRGGADPRREGMVLGR